MDVGSCVHDLVVARHHDDAAEKQGLNRSAIQTTVVVAITSNLRLGAMPGNVRLRKGEANLPRPSVVNVTQVRTVARDRLTERVGHLAPARVREVMDGLALVFGIDPVGS
jgi:mRNA interferase MazF